MKQRASILLAGGVLVLALFGEALADDQWGWQLYRAGDYAGALKEWRPLAEQGDVGAQFWLGLMYAEGHGVPQDYEQAVYWYRKAADRGEDGAQGNLGDLYAKGQGVPQDYAQAFDWYRKSAEQGNTYSQGKLGEMYANGQGVRQDLVQGFFWLGRAAELRWDLDAQRNFDSFVYANPGIIGSLRKAAEQGDAIAQYDLGEMYADGKGAPQDYVEAHIWFNLAASRIPTALREKAAEGRDEMAAKMTPGQIAEAQRLAQEWKPTK